MGFLVIYETLGEPQGPKGDHRFVLLKRRTIKVIRSMLGGSTSVVKSLAEAEKKKFKGKVQVIYINLPGIIEFGSKTFLRLAYLRDRLVESRELLTETGSIFCQTSNKNIHLVRCLLDGIFGSENFIQPEQIKALLTHLSKTALRGLSRENLKLFSELFDFTLCYAKQKKEITQ